MNGRILAPGRAKEAAMAHSGTVTFLSYWRGLQTRPDQAPARERFDPAALKSLIPQLIMLSGDDHVHRFRLAGGFVSTFHGYELKDTAFPALFRSPYIDTVHTALVMSRRREQPLLLTLSAPWRSFDTVEDDEASHSETVSFEVCLCPLRGLSGQADRFVGVYQTTSAPPRNPRGAIGRYNLVSSRLYEPNRGAGAAHLRLVVDEGKRIA
jgi:hypothetical protein